MSHSFTKHCVPALINGFNIRAFLNGNLMSEAALCLTEQIKPQHIVGEDSLDNDEEPRKGERGYA